MTELYKNKKYGFPIVTFIFLLTCSIVTISTYFDNHLVEIFATINKKCFIWQYYTGIFEHTIYPKWFLWVHFLTNMSILILFGTVIERNLGSFKMLIITIIANITSCGITFQSIFSSKQLLVSVGASGIVYAYAPIALYIFYMQVKNKKKKILKEPLFYIIVLEYIYIWGVITEIATWEQTNKYHVVATITGIVLLEIFRTKIKKEVNELTSENIQFRTNKSKIYLILFILPISMIAIIILFELGIITPFSKLI